VGTLKKFKFPEYTHDKNRKQSLKNGWKADNNIQRDYIIFKRADDYKKNILSPEHSIFVFRHYYYSVS